MRLIFAIVMVVGGFGGLRTARAANDLPELKIENPAGQAVAELNENNIEQALAEHEALRKGAKGGTTKATTTPSVALDGTNTESISDSKNADDSAHESIAQKKESEIPVQLESRKSAATEGSPFVKMILGLIVVSGLAFAAWVMVRRYQFQNKGKNPATQMKVLSQFHLGPKKSLAIVRVAGESMLIGITDHHIGLIKSLAMLDEDMPEEAPQDFGTAYGSAFQKLVKRGGKAPARTEDMEEFAISGIKDFVSTRLKNMRNID